MVNLGGSEKKCQKMCVYYSSYETSVPRMAFYVRWNQWDLDSFPPSSDDEGVIDNGLLDQNHLRKLARGSQLGGLRVNDHEHAIMLTINGMQGQN